MSMVFKLGVHDVRVIEGVPRLRDVRIADRLGFSRPHDIRKLIERYREQLERHGELVTRRHGGASHGGGSPGLEYRLNEAQALLICMRSDAQNADEIRQEIIAVFLATRHRTALPPTPAADVLLAPDHPSIERVEDNVVHLKQAELFEGGGMKPPRGLNLNTLPECPDGACPCCYGTGYLLVYDAARPNYAPTRHRCGHCIPDGED